MIEQQSQQLRRVTILLDLSLTAFVFLASYWFRLALADGSRPELLAHIALLPVIAPIWFFLLTAFGAYRSPHAISRLEYVSAVIRGVGTGVALLLTLLFFLKVHDVGRGIVLTFAVLDVLALIGVRLGGVWYFQRSLQNREDYRKLLIIGTGNRARHLVETLTRNAGWGIHIVGHLDPDPTRLGRQVLGSPVLGTIDSIRYVLKDHVIDEVILAVPRGMLSDVEKIARVCEEEGVKFLLMADVFDVNIARMRLVQSGAIPLLTFEPVAQEEWKLLVKRMMDLTLTLLMVPVLVPVMGLIALAIKLDSRGPVFFVQERVGLNKRRFRMLKFRSMVDGADRLQAEVEHLNEAQGPNFKIANDPRITRVGGFLRRTSLDEVPQTFNVLRGEMSLVGPRPMSLRDVELFDESIQRKRFSVRPGLTCLWQISGRSQLPFSKWLELDLDYIERWSLGLDLKILFKTIPAVLKGTGAA